MKQSMKKLLSTIGYYRLLRMARSGTALLILMYHDLAGDSESGSTDSVLRERTVRSHFEAHLRALKRNCRVMSVEEAVREIRCEGRLLADTVSITFDDGYRSVYDIAYPLLLDYGMNATVYLTTDWINGRMELWWEQVADMITHCDLESARLQDLEGILSVGIAPSSASRKDPLERRSELYRFVAGCLRSLSDLDLRSRLARLRDVFDYDHPLSAPAEPLSWAQVREMDANGIRFGSHTCSHLNIGRAPLELIEEEIGRSKAEIRRRIDSEVEGFAYPYGQDIESYRRLEPILAGHGFSYACTAVPGSNSDESNLFALFRETLPPTDSGALLERELMLDLAARGMH